MSVKVVNSGSGVIKITASTLPAVKVEEPEVSVIKVNPVVTGNITAPAGPTGPAGAAGQGVEAGGDKHQVLKKASNDDYDTEWGFADRVFISVKFDEAVSAGDPVYVSGYQSGQDVVIVSKADSSDSSKMPAIGLAIEDKSQNDFGSVACIGSLYGVDTDDFTVGDVLYVKSGGGLTAVKPTGESNLIQNVGKVGRSNQNNGEIVVMAIGRSNDVPNIGDGKIWIGDALGIPTPTLLKATIIPDFDVEVSNNTDVVANTAKETNVTTDLSFTRDATSVTVISSDGDDAVLPESSLTQAGVMSAASHTKLANLSAAADATTETTVSAAGAVMDSDFTANGLMERTGDGAYTTVAKSTTSIPEGTNLYYTDARADARIAAASVGDLTDGGDVVFTTTSDVSSASFVDTDDTFASATNNLVPSQLAVKNYVNNQLKPAIYSDTSDNPQLASGVTEAEIKELLNLEPLDLQADVIGTVLSIGMGQVSFTTGGSGGILSYTGPSDTDIRGKVSSTQNAASGDGTLSYSQSTGVISYTPPDLSSYLTSVSESDVTAHEAALEITVSQISDFGTYLTGSSSTSDLSDVNGDGTADGQLLIYNQSTGKYDVNTLSEGDNITITEGAGTITIAATDTGISNVQADSTPSLGGNLNVNDFHIVSDASEHITIEAGSGGDVNIDGEPVNIKHAGTTRLATSGTGIDVTGHLDMADDDEIRLGTGNDFRITYDSANDDGELRAETIALKGSNDENMLRANTDGAVSLYHNASRKFDTTASGVSVTGYATATGYATDFSSALSAVGNHRGATLVEGVYSSGSITNGKVYQMGSTAWAEGHADGEATASGMLAIATSTSASGKFVTKGLVKVLDIKGTTPSKGDIVYLSEDAAESGYVTVDRPSADGDIVRIVGYVVNSTADMIYFDPSPDFIEVA